MDNVTNDIFSYLVSKIGTNHQVYLTGGSARDCLLNIPFNDFDFVTDLTPDKTQQLFPDADVSFARFGIINLHINGKHVTLATLRKDGKYDDSRHPSKVSFIKDVETDCLRRDFTINAIYICADGSIKDPLDGQIDLNKHIIRMIGDIPTRINEDPLRIIRAIRFSYKLNFTIEKDLLEYITGHAYLLKKLNPDKAQEEISKATKEAQDKLNILMRMK